VKGWVSGLVNEMRKKSPASIQKWVDSIAKEDEADEQQQQQRHQSTSTSDSKELNKIEEPSTSAAVNEKLKGKINELCNKLNVKNKKIDFKNLLTKTTQKLKKGLSEDEQAGMEQNEEHNNKISNMTADDDDDDDDEEDGEEEGDDVEEPEINLSNGDTNKLSIQRCHIGLLGRSSSENPNPRSRRLNDIGRSFSVATDNEIALAANGISTENFIYDADEDISITIPSTSPSIISNNTNMSLSNSQLDRNLNVPGRSPVLRSLREHTVSEGHQSPQALPKNPLLRDSSFQVTTANGISLGTIFNSI